MIEKIQGKKVDVCQQGCGRRSCFRLGQDKGTFTPGRGYTSYHKTPRWVCMTRHLHGCPVFGVCPTCKVGTIEGETKCNRCGGPLVTVEEFKLMNQTKT